MGIVERLKDIDDHWKVSGISIFIISIFGILPSLVLCNWEWFSRSGSLLIIYGVFIVWLDHKGKIDTALDLVEEATLKKFGPNDAALEKEDNTSPNLYDVVNEIKVNNKNLYEKIEFLIISVGTIIWGYGDLVNSIYS